MGVTLFILVFGEHPFFTLDEAINGVGRNVSEGHVGVGPCPCLTAAAFV